MRSRRFECSNDNCYKFKKCPATLKSHLCLLNGKVKLYTNLEGHNSDEIDDGPRRGIFKPIKEFIRGLLKEQPLLTSRKILSKIYKFTSDRTKWPDLSQVQNFVKLERYSNGNNNYFNFKMFKINKNLLIRRC